MKYSLKVLAISASWDRILSSSTKVILERILTLSEIFDLTIFQKTLSLICHFTDIKITIEILFLFPQQTSNIVTLFVIYFSINITFCVKKFVS